jgi:hypothetical protein
MSKELNNLPEELIKIVKDFITDMLNTFPEYKDKFTDNELEYLKKDGDNEKLKISFDYFKTVYPERFFDILYENEELFTDAAKNTKFFANIDFKDIWKENISDNTKNIIWKYLQLMLFSLSKNIDGTETFGDTAQMFEAIDEDVLKKKLEEVISSMNDVFDMSNNNQFEEMMKNMKEKMDVSGIPNMDMFEEMMKNMQGNMQENMDVSGIPNAFEEMMKNMQENMQENMDVSGIPNMDMFEEMMKNMQENMQENMQKDISGESKNIPDPDDIQNHLNSLMGGKIGKLAQEIADETASELDIDASNINGIGDIFSKLFKNPGQLMSMIKKVSSKLDQKLKSGEIKEAELMKEANELVEKMKNTPGMKDMEKMLGKMGMGGNGGKVNMNMFQSMMKSNIKKSSQKERMLDKLKQRNQEREIMEKIKQSQKQPSQKDMQDYDEYIQKTFKLDETNIKKSKIKNKKKNKKNKKNKKK